MATNVAGRVVTGKNNNAIYGNAALPPVSVECLNIALSADRERKVSSALKASLLKSRCLMQNNQQNQITALEKRVVELEQQLARIQNTDTARFNRIACRELQVVSDTGELFITMCCDDEDFGGPVIKLLDNTGDCLIQLHADEHGGVIAVSPTQQVNPADEFSINMYVDENRNGYLSVCGTDGADRVILNIEPPSRGGAGRVAICGEIDNHERVVIGSDPETDDGSIKTYSGTSIETDSLGNGSGVLRIIGAPVGNSQYFRSQRYIVEKIDEKLQGETDETRKRILNVKRKKAAEMLSQIEENESS